MFFRLERRCFLDFLRLPPPIFSAGLCCTESSAESCTTGATGALAGSCITCALCAGSCITCALAGSCITGSCSACCPFGLHVFSIFAIFSSKFFFSASIFLSNSFFASLLRFSHSGFLLK